MEAVRDDLQSAASYGTRPAAGAAGRPGAGPQPGLPGGHADPAHGPGLLRPAGPFELVRNAVATAATAPSGANLQPWRFVVVSDPERKRCLRAAAEQEERAFYGSRASAEWLAALEPLGTGQP
jgi:Nitroreductase family